MEAILYLIIFIGVIAAGLIKYAQKRELSGKLGREVEDHELVSLNSWIEAERKEDARKGIKVEPPSVQIKKQSVAVAKEPIQEAEKEPIENSSEKETEIPDNCLKCGAALSKEIAYCRFCGTHSSREALEDHVSIFLHDLGKDFENSIPASHDHLTMGCLFIPLLALVAATAAYFFLPPLRYRDALVIGIPLISLIVAYIWSSVADNFVTKKQGQLFEQNIEPKIRQFMKEHDLRNLEILSIGKRKLLKESKLLKHIYRRF